VFLIGSLLAVEYWNVQHGRLPRLPASLARVLPWALDGLAIAALVVVACMTPEIASLIAGQKVAVNAFHKAFLLYCLLWSCVLLACFHGHGWVRRFFEWQPLRFLGFISFSFYLLHVIVLKGGVFLADRLHLGTFPGLGWLIFLVTTLVSYASYRIVEKPLAQLRLPQRRAKPTPAPADPAATEQSVASKPTVPAEASV
jgi:peptidoglycan/LPS O-acetylase OafA/YrhL